MAVYLRREPRAMSSPKVARMGLPSSPCGGGEEHAVGFEAAHLAGGEVGDD